MITRRDYLAGTGASALVLGLSQYAAAQAGVTIRQGYQTNMWGMPTYYLMRSGLLEKKGLKFEEFGVPSGNLTMQQMVARQVDLGTYAGQSFIIGHDKGGLVALVVVETVGRTARVMSRKDLNITKIEDLKGKKVANQTGSSLGNIFVDQLAPKHGLEEGRLPGSPHERERHDRRHVGQDRGRHGQHRAVQHDRRGGRHRDHDHGLFQRRLDAGVHGGNAGLRGEESGRGRRLSAGVARGRRGIQEEPREGVGRRSTRSSPPRATTCPRTFSKRRSGTVDVNPGWPAGLEAYMQKEAEVLLREKKIAAIPDWKKALRPDFWSKASA